MQANNTINITGNVGNDPVSRAVGQDRLVTTLDVAVSRPYKNKQGEYDSDWFSCEVWDAQAEWVIDNIKKGNKVGIVGSMHNQSWEKDGVKKTKAVIKVGHLQKL